MRSGHPWSRRDAGLLEHERGRARGDEPGEVGRDQMRQGLQSLGAGVQFGLSSKCHSKSGGEFLAGAVGADAHHWQQSTVAVSHFDCFLYTTLLLST